MNIIGLYSKFKKEVNMVIKGNEIEKKKCLITEKATKLFFYYGFKKTSIGEIAKECSMSVGSLYNFFKNKEDILACCAKDCYDESIDLLEPLINKEMAADKKLRETMLAMHLYPYEKFKDTKHGLEIMLADFPNKEELDMESYNVKHKIIKNILKSGVDDGIFKIDNLNKFTKTFLDSFAKYNPPMSVEMKRKDIVDGVNAIMDIMFLAIRNEGEQK